MTIRRVAIVALGFCLCAVAGCAPLARSWADRRTEKAIEAAVADDTFPTAAEAGLAGADPGPAD